MSARWHLAVFISLLLFVCSAEAQVSVRAVVPGVCGNGVVEVLEQCDLADLGGASCLSLGYASGTLACSETCSFVTEQCVPWPPQEEEEEILPKVVSGSRHRFFWSRFSLLPRIITSPVNQTILPPPPVGLKVPASSTRSVSGPVSVSSGTLPLLIAPVSWFSYWWQLLIRFWTWLWNLVF